MPDERQHKTHRIYNYKFEKPDTRDLHFSQVGEVKRLKVTALPKIYTLRKWFSAIEDQGELGSCTANAWVGVMEFHQNFMGRGGKQFEDLSRLFIYYNERVIEGNVNQDSGAELRSGAQTLAKDGVCTERLWPYNINAFKQKPTQNCYNTAKVHKIINYYTINSFNNLKISISNNLPVAFGFNVYESFETEAVSQTGIVPMPDVKNEALLGGHAVVLVGYNDYEQRFLVRNSWGKDWGLHGTNAGYFTMPYNYIANSNLASDFWTVVKIAEDP